MTVFVHHALIHCFDDQRAVYVREVENLNCPTVPAGHGCPETGSHGQIFIQGGGGRVGWDIPRVDWIVPSYRIL